MELELGNVKPSVYNFLVIGVSATAFIVLGKYLVERFNNPATNFFKDVMRSV